jgi:arylsulfatase A-like enzyme
MDSSIATFPRILSKNGWHTAALGKCHFTPVTEPHGYDELQLMEEIPESIEDDVYLQSLQEKGYNDLRNIHGVRPLSYHEVQNALIPEEDLGPNWLGEHSAKWIDENSDKPFLLTLGWIKPHPPWNIPDSKKGMYAAADLPEPLERSRNLPFPPEESHLYGDTDTPEEKRKIREAYMESVSMVDEAFGKVLAALERKGILDNTVIIYTADHGEMLQDKGFYQKTLPYDSACRIPMVVRYPEKFKDGSVREDFVDLLDVFPTLLDIAGIEKSDIELDGESLLSADSPKRKIQYAHSCKDHYRWVMTRDERYKYIYYFAGGHEYLYDMQNDPVEKDNLLGTDACPQDVYEKLKAEAIRREQTAGPEGSLKDGAFVPSETTRHPEFDWNNGEKFPRWCFMAGHMQSFGDKTPQEEAELFLKEFMAARGKKPDEKIYCPPEAKSMLLGSYSEKWGGDPAELEKLLA